jgi:hypothetical protein
MAGLFNLGLIRASSTKRKVFFSFHYKDIMRVNNVRLSQEFKTSDNPSGGRPIEGFYDRSLWESKKLSGPDALKQLIRDGVHNTSVVCVLAGTETYARRWVRYEIARSVIDEKGLLTVHINSLPHHQHPRQPHPQGPNPTAFMGVAQRDDGTYRLCERNYTDGAWKWVWYSDYVSDVPIPRYIGASVLKGVVPLSAWTSEYDWRHGGHNSVGGWIDRAAHDAGR